MELLERPHLRHVRDFPSITQIGDVLLTRMIMTLLAAAAAVISLKPSHQTWTSEFWGLWTTEPTLTYRPLSKQSSAATSWRWKDRPLHNANDPEVPPPSLDNRHAESEVSWETTSSHPGPWVCR